MLKNTRGIGDPPITASAAPVARRAHVRDRATRPHPAIRVTAHRVIARPAKLLPCPRTPKNARPIPADLELAACAPGACLTDGTEMPRCR